MQTPWTVWDRERAASEVHTPRRRGRRRGGFALPLALVATLVLLVLGLSYLQGATTSLLDATRYRNDVTALALAEGSAELMLTLLYEDYYDAAGTLFATGSAGPFNLDTGAGRMWVQASHPYLGTDFYVLVDARGHVAPHAGEVLGDGLLTRLLPLGGLMPPAYASAPETAKRGHVFVVAKVLTNNDRIFEGALWSDNGIELRGNGGILPDENGKGDSVYANGNIAFIGNTFNMGPTGELYATGSIVNPPAGVPPSGMFNGVAAMDMPVIDPAYYLSIADYVHNGDMTVQGNESFPVSEGVIYIDGNLRLSGNFSGNYTIVVTGNVEITGNAELGDPSQDKLAILAMGDVTFTGTPELFDGLVYSMGTVYLSGNPYIQGAVVAGNVRVLNGNPTIQYAEVWDGARLPGFVKPQYASISWQRVQ